MLKGAVQTDTIMLKTFRDSSDEGKDPSAWTTAKGDLTVNSAQARSTLSHGSGQCG